MACVMTCVMRSGSLENQPCFWREKFKVKRKPDFLLILMAVFGMGVLVTLILPMANNSVAAPASELQADVIIRD